MFNWAEFDFGKLLGCHTCCVAAESEIQRVGERHVEQPVKPQAQVTAPARGEADASAAQASTEHGWFEVSLEKLQSHKWALDLDYGQKKHLLITGVRDGPVGLYNESHPEQKIEAGDWIERVNDVTNAPHAMAEHIITQDKVKLMIRKSWYSGDIPGISENAASNPEKKSEITVERDGVKKKENSLSFSSVTKKREEAMQTATEGFPAPLNEAAASEAATSETASMTASGYELWVKARAEADVVPPVQSETAPVGSVTAEVGAPSPPDADTSGGLSLEGRGEHSPERATPDDAVTADKADATQPEAAAKLDMPSTPEASSFGEEEPKTDLTVNPCQPIAEEPGAVELASDEGQSPKPSSENLDEVVMDLRTVKPVKPTGKMPVEALRMDCKMPMAARSGKVAADPDSPVFLEDSLMTDPLVAGGTAAEEAAMGDDVAQAAAKPGDNSATETVLDASAEKPSTGEPVAEASVEEASIAEPVAEAEICAEVSSPICAELHEVKVSLESRALNPSGTMPAVTEQKVSADDVGEPSLTEPPVAGPTSPLAEEADVAASAEDSPKPEAEPGEEIAVQEPTKAESGAEAEEAEPAVEVAVGIVEESSKVEPLAEAEDSAEESSPADPAHQAIKVSLESRALKPSGTMPTETEPPVDASVDGPLQTMPPGEAAQVEAEASVSCGEQSAAEPASVAKGSPDVFEPELATETAAASAGEMFTEIKEQRHDQLTRITADFTEQLNRITAEFDINISTAAGCTEEVPGQSPEALSTADIVNLPKLDDLAALKSSDEPQGEQQPAASEPAVSQISEEQQPAASEPAVSQIGQDCSQETAPADAAPESQPEVDAKIEPEIDVEIDAKIDVETDEKIDVQADVQMDAEVGTKTDSQIDEETLSKVQADPTEVASPEVRPAGNSDPEATGAPELKAPAEALAEEDSSFPVEVTEKSEDPSPKADTIDVEGLEMTQAGAGEPKSEAPAEAQLIDTEGAEVTFDPEVTGEPKVKAPEEESPASEVKVTEDDREVNVTEESEEAPAKSVGAILAEPDAESEPKAEVGAEGLPEAPTAAGEDSRDEQVPDPAPAEGSQVESSTPEEAPASPPRQQGEASMCQGGQA